MSYKEHIRAKNLQTVCVIEIYMILSWIRIRTIQCLSLFEERKFSMEQIYRKNIFDL